MGGAKIAIRFGDGLRDAIGLTRMGWGGGVGLGRAARGVGSGFCLRGVGSGFCLRGAGSEFCLRAAGSGLGLLGASLNCRVEWKLRVQSSICDRDRFFGREVDCSASSVPSSPRSTKSDAAECAGCRSGDRCDLVVDCVPPRHVTCEAAQCSILCNMNLLTCTLAPRGVPQHP